MNPRINMVGKDIPQGEDVSLGIDSGQREGGHGEKMFPLKKMCSFGMENGWEKV